VHEIQPEVSDEVHALQFAAQVKVSGYNICVALGAVQFSPLVTFNTTLEKTLADKKFKLKLTQFFWTRYGCCRTGGAVGALCSMFLIDKPKNQYNWGRIARSNKHTVPPPRLACDSCLLMSPTQTID
jgi:hypothetical protein